MNIDFNEVVEKNSTRIYRLIYSLVKNKTETEDLTQEVFLTAFRKISNFRGDSEIFSWLYRIAVNKCKDYFRKYKLKRILSLNTLTRPDEEKPELDFPDFSANPDTIVSQNEIQNITLSKINQLPDKYRIPIMMDLNGFTIKETAVILKISEGTIKSLISRGKKKLREQLKDVLTVATI